MSAVLWSLSEQGSRTSKGRLINSAWGTPDGYPEQVMLELDPEGWQKKWHEQGHGGGKSGTHLGNCSFGVRQDGARPWGTLSVKLKNELYQGFHLIRSSGLVWKMEQTLRRSSGGGGGMNWVIGIDMYTLMCIKWMTNKNLMYKKINKIKFFFKFKKKRKK